MSVEFGGATRSLSKPIPERIKEAREARGFTLDGFAEHLGLSKQAIAQFETGQASPSGETMAAIFATTRQPPAFFFKPRERTNGRPFWRSLKRMTQPHRRRIARRLEWASDIVRYVEQFIELPAVNIPQVDFDPLRATDEQIEAVATHVRDAWGLGRGPIKDLVSVLEANGVLLIRESVDCPDMDAVSCWYSGRPLVLFADEVRSGPRSKFNLAHELAHLTLHASVGLTVENLGAIERQAHRFAGAFLLPRESFSQEILGSSIKYFLSLKERWGVSLAAMAYRCKDLDIFTDNQYSYLMKQMNLLQIRKAEPLDDIPVGTPTIFAESLRMLMRHGVQTRDQIEAALSLNMGDVERLCGLPSGSLDVRVIQFQPRPKSV